MRYRRVRIAKLTDEQKALERYADRAAVRQMVIFFDRIVQADLESSFSKRSKTVNVERSKVRRKDPKPKEAKTK
jgi:hypothetical protein